MTGSHLRAVSIFALSAGVTLLSGHAVAYQTVMLRNSGPVSNRVNIVILGDGYLASELDQLETDARTALSNIDQEPFYREYANFLNVKLVLTSSSSNVIGYGAPGSTLFGLYFGCEGMDRLICIGNNAQVASVLSQDAPEWDFVAIIANSTTYGGSGGQFVTFTRDANSTEVFIHETAHQYGGLADEYPDAYPSYPVCGSECPEPNVTPVGTTWQNLKWNYWVDPSTPLPTPDTATYLNVIGAFEGARYMSTGLYRPRHTCRMRETNQRFCEVCAEAHVLETYRMVSAFDVITPSTNQVGLVAGGTLQLAVAHPQTASNSVRYSWLVDGSAYSSVGPALSLAANALSTGQHTVEVQLSDETTLVGRDDALLHKHTAWTVSVAGPSTGGAGGTSATTSAVSTGGAPPPTGGTSAIITSMQTGGASSATGGASQIAGGASATTARTASSSGGTAAANIGGTSSTGATVQTGGNSTQPLGGISSVIGGASTSTGIGAPSNQAGSQATSQGGSVGRSTRSTKESVEKTTVGCDCGIPAKPGSPTVAWLFGAMLLWPLRRGRRRSRHV